MPDWSTNNIKIILKILVDQSGVDYSGWTRYIFQYLNIFALFSDEILNQKIF